MAKEWTAAQRQAIESYGGKLVVSAGAGSGKTSVLVQRAITHIARRGIDADRLLIITFTNSAADELKGRLFRELDKAAAADPSLNRQKVLIRRAHIGTFDSFCKKLCFEHFAQLDIPPDFMVAAGPYAEAMRSAALEQTLEYMYSDKEFRRLSDMFGTSRSDRQLEDLIIALHDHLARLRDPAAYRELCLTQLSGGKSLDRSAFGAYLLGRAESGARYMAQLSEKGREICLADEVLHNKYLPVFMDMRYQADRLLEQMRNGYDAAAAAAAQISFLRLPVLPRGYSSPEQEAAKEIKTACASILKRLTERYLFSGSESYAEECALMLPAAQALFRAQEQFEQRLLKLKRSRRAYEFSDISRLALKLLVKDGLPTPLAKELSENYVEVMVDEYQDTDDLQGAVYGAVSGEGERLFIVGDSKQSIYRFRKAEPRIMLRERELAHPAGENRFPMEVKLLENFRSAPCAIAAVNSVFDQLMTRRNGDVDYAGERLVAGTPGNGEGVGLSLSVIPAADNADEIQARFIAKKIKRLMAEDRELDFSDFAVLAASVKNRGGTYERVFKEEGLPLFADVAATVYSTDEGALLLSVLSAVDNPLRDLELAALLTSPGIGFGARELLSLRNVSRSGPLYPILLADARDEYKRAAGMISELMYLKARVPVEELAAHAVKLLKLDLWALSRPGGEYRLGNLQGFIEAARETCEATGASLPQFVRLAQRAKEGGSAERRAPPPGMVQLKTIHTAKGLEWKYVFLAHTEQQFRTTPDLPLLFDGELGMGARVLRRTEEGVSRSVTAAYGALAASYAEKSVSENMRLLYVALTRAQRRTFAIASPKPDSKTHQSLFNVSRGVFSLEELTAGCRSFYEWILLSMITAHPRETAEFSLEQGVMRLGNTELEVAPAPMEAEDAEPDCPRPITPEQAAELSRRIGFVSPEAELSAIPAKQSVTGLSKPAEDINIAQPAFSLARGLTGAQRGTALHMFMQYADYFLAKQDPENELARLVDRRYIDESYAEGIEIGRLKVLLDSEFFARILAADRILREYEFFLPVPSSELSPQGDPKKQVVIQGIADCVAITGDSAIIVDYKSDRNVTEDALRERYSAQLSWYKRAVERALEVTVAGCYVYSFSLGGAVQVC